jgi:hypothetical protein
MMKTVSCQFWSNTISRFINTIVLSVIILHAVSATTWAASATVSWDANAQASYYVVY